MGKRVRILGVPIDQVTMDSAIKTVVVLTETHGCSMVFTPNPEIVMMAREDHGLLGAMEKADLIVPDGIGLIYASKLKSRGLKERVPGIELAQGLLIHCNEYKKSIYLLGGKPGVAQQAGEELMKKYPELKIVGVRDGYFKETEDKELIEEINQSKAEILFVALGAPKQEKWIEKYQQDLNVKVAMGVGGSIDVWAGIVKRAPVFYQKVGLEWFYRLIKEPSRYKRMLILPKFLLDFILKDK
ncbi:glycosyl transferase, WecB/TagA/CpsF family [Alkaliphilus metalliredigens QYMF]|uniref:N-acetylglucosaminyldiphosphoundecaprenol N-acetyl-beta-D-mannosaminyltransferase n=1 Tax=Alkaliphilus metalliredigens (strain QYMF) TaxID=293826 RepID=A6TVK2_ALKMQ|nr:WecB/TagA/CpsF family glycosyltransferase [Alkaliphilus metalliredigens]ABR50220.1 glycosyl transferase, WecB/TagA/CpsF family [Alkaliphilus metalliredigens QYMF]